MEEKDKLQEETNPIQEEKAPKSNNGKKIAIIIVVLILIVAAAATAFYFVNKTDDDDKESKNEISNVDENDDEKNNDDNNNDDDYDYEYDYDFYYTEEELEELEANLEFEKVGETRYGEFVFSIKNNNKEKVIINDVDIILRDEDGNFLDKISCTLSYFAIAGKSEIITYTYEGSYATPEYATYEFKVELDEYKETDYITVENFEISSIDNGKAIAAEVVNNNDFAVSDIELEIIYYKDGEVIGASYDYDSSVVKSGESAYITLDYAYDSEYDDIVDFDDYEIYVYYSYINE